VVYTHRITGFLDFFPSSGILENRKHDVSELDVSVLKRRREKTPTQLRLPLNGPTE
jgi:hypothetical protein